MLPPHPVLRGRDSGREGRRQGHLWKPLSGSSGVWGSGCLGLPRPVSATLSGCQKQRVGDACLQRSAPAAETSTQRLARSPLGHPDRSRVECRWLRPVDTACLTAACLLGLTATVERGCGSGCSPACGPVPGASLGECSLTPPCGSPVPYRLPQLQSWVPSNAAAGQREAEAGSLREAWAPSPTRVVPAGAHLCSPRARVMWAQVSGQGGR